MFILLKQYARIGMNIITNQLCWRTGASAVPTLDAFDRKDG